LLSSDKRMSFGQQSKVFIKNNPAITTFFIAILLLLLTFVFNPKSLNLNTFSSTLMLTVLLSIASAGQTIVLIGGGLDFTVGAVMSSTAILTSYIMDGQSGRFWLVFLLAMGIGIIVGLLNGIFTVKISLPAMITTMAISNVVTRMQYVLTQGSPSGYTSQEFTQTVSYRIGGFLPAIVMYAAILWPIVFFLINRSSFGKQLFLVGSNPTAAKLNGVKVNRIRVLSYVFSAMMSAFAGMLGAAYMTSARCQIFDEYAFQSLIAVIVGGTAFSGGVGTFGGTIAGSLLMVVLSNMLTAMQLETTTKSIATGVIMILLLVIYNRSKAVRQ
jgi:ribose transport system permease protein